MKFDIPKEYYIRWQAALAVLEDLEEDKKAPFNMHKYASLDTTWSSKCGTSACYAGYISVAPYCIALGLPESNGHRVANWLCPSAYEYGLLWRNLFKPTLNKGTRIKTLAYLKRTLKSIFKASTGKTLKAPLTFYVD